MRGLRCEYTLRHILGVLPSLNYEISTLFDATRARRDILRSRSILVDVGDRRISDLMERIRQSWLHPADFRDLAPLLSLASCDGSHIFPIDLEGWRKVWVRFQLCDLISRSEWLRIFLMRESVSIDSPRALLRYPDADIHRLSIELAGAVHILSLWRAACFT